MFKRKKKHNFKARLEIQNMDEMKQLISEAQSLMHQLENELNFYKKHKNKLKSLTTKLDKKVKDINEFQFKFNTQITRNKKGGN